MTLDVISMKPTCPRCGGKHGVEVSGDGYEHDCAACGGHLICAIGDEGEMYPWHREDGSCGCNGEPHTCDPDDDAAETDDSPGDLALDDYLDRMVAGTLTKPGREELARMVRARDGFVELHDRKAAWSIETFGPGDRYAGVVAHIRKELAEIEAAPADLVEWCDVILLAMDGAMRSCGATGAELLAAMCEKQALNEKRTWPDWRELKPGEVSEHVDEEADHG